MQTDRAERQQQRNEHTRRNPIWFAVQVGFFGAVIFGFVRGVVHYFQFTEVDPGFLLKPFVSDDFLAGTGGYAAGFLSFLAVSIIASLLYLIFASKLKGPWPGILYGVLWFLVLYMLIGMLFGMVPPLGVISWDSLWSDFTIFVFWGVFIGYAISFEYTDERQREKEKTMLNLQ